MITKKQWLTALFMFLAFLLIRHYFFRETPITQEQIRSNYEKFTPAEKAAVQAALRYFTEGEN